EHIEGSMPRRPHPRFATLLKWLSRQRHLAMAVNGEFYRVAGPRYTTANDIVCGRGGFIAGGRWHPIGGMKGVYLSQEPETAMTEALEHFRYHLLPISQALPKVMVAVAVRIDRVLDLTDPAVATGLPIPMPELMAEDWRALMSSNREPG